MEFFVYIIQSKSTRTFYTGMANDIERRLSEHNGRTKGTKTTYNNHDYYLVFVQITGSRKEARSLEKYLKSGIGRETRKEILKQD